MILPCRLFARTAAVVLRISAIFYFEIIIVTNNNYNEVLMIQSTFSIIAVYVICINNCYFILMIIIKLFIAGLKGGGGEFATPPLDPPLSTHMTNTILVLNRLLTLQCFRTREE